MRYDRGIWTLVVAGLALRLALAWSGWSEGPLLADDAFYYFRIAANLAAGHGSTFDGLTPTNGYHPLWLGLLVPVFATLGASVWLPVKAALTLATLCDLVTGLAVIAIVRTLAGGARATLAAGFWFLTPLTVLISLRGMEAAVSAMFVALVFWRLARLTTRGSRPGGREALICGVLVGLAGLARLDNLPVLALAVFAWAVCRGRLAANWSPRARLIWLAAVGSVAALVVLPWFAWNAARFGSLVPVSGQVKALIPIHGHLDHDPTSLRGWLEILTQVSVAPIFHAARFVSLEEFASARLALVVTAGVVAAIAVPAVLRRRALAAWLRASGAGPWLVATAVFLLGHTLLTTVIWRTYLNWYALPSLALISVLLSLVQAPGAGRPGRRRSYRALLVVAAVATVALSIHVLRGLPGGPAHGERRHAERLQAVAAAYPAGVQAGAFNAGLLGYLAPHHGDITVINLDGVVNARALAAARAGRLSRYMLANVEVLLEKPGTGYLHYRPGELAALRARYRKWPGRAVWSRDRLPATIDAP